MLYQNTVLGKMQNQKRHLTFLACQYLQLTDLHEFHLLSIIFVFTIKHFRHLQSI